MPLLLLGWPQGLGDYCSQALYGGTYMSVYGALVWRTNVSTVLQLVWINAFCVCACFL